MNYLKRYNEWEKISEATLDNSKDLVDYTISTTSYDKIELLGVSRDIKLVPTKSLPNDKEFVIQIKASSFRLIEFSKFIEMYKIEDVNDIIIYNTSSTKYPYAVALKGIRTTMLKQADRKGASARGNYFRETAFIITLASRLWETKGIKISLYSNKDRIKMDFRKGFAVISLKERLDFRNEYDAFMANNKIVEGMNIQIDSLIKYLGDSIFNIKAVLKNSSELLINKLATDFLKEEEDLHSDIFKTQSQNISDFNTFEIPTGVTLSKWNPSDIWILYKDADWTLNDPK